MPQTPDTAALTLAGLASANGPWLAARLLRLMEVSGLTVPGEVAQQAVDAASRLLIETLGIEGRPDMNPDAAADPVTRMGREQAQAHQRAGLSLPASLKVQRLLRRAYDDLVRESWVEKDSRARAHEDVERFFERALVGLAAAWTGYDFARPDAALAELVARREDELRRTLDAAKKLTKALRESHGREQALAERLAKTAAAARKLRDRLRALEAEQAASPPARPGADRDALGETRPQSDAEAELARLQQRFESRRADTAAAEARAEALSEELRALREAHASLASDAEAMRARLSEAGSRVSELRRAQEQRTEDRLAAALKDLERAGGRIAELEAELEAEQETGQRQAADFAAARDRARTLAEERESLLREGERLNGAVHRLEADFARLSTERDGLAAEREGLRGEQKRLQERLAALEAEGARGLELLSSTQVALLNARAELEDLRKAADPAEIISPGEST